MANPGKHWLQSTGGKYVLIALVALAGALLWRYVQPAALPEGIAKGNGRIEAVEIDIAAKTAGRISSINVDEGDYIKAGTVLVEMDTAQLQAQRRAAEAQLRRAEIGIRTAKSVVAQSQAETRAAAAVVAQRKVQLDAADRKLSRTEQLARRQTVSLQTLDDDRAAQQGAKAALEAAGAQLSAAEAATSTADAQVVDAEAAVEAAKATLQSLDVQLADSTLASPLDGRVQYRVAQPGEIVAAGGRVLNLVDLGSVFMNFFLPTRQAGQVALGAPVLIVLDAAPEYAVPAKVTFVADVAQFTPKTVETQEEREKLMFRVKARVSRKLLLQHLKQVKTGLPGMAYVKLSADVPWPDELADKKIVSYEESPADAPAAAESETTQQGSGK